MNHRWKKKQMTVRGAPSRPVGTAASMPAYWLTTRRLPLRQHLFHREIDVASLRHHRGHPAPGRWRMVTVSVSNDLVETSLFLVAHQFAECRCSVARGYVRSAPNRH
jgi:hypothetical protein